MCEREREDGGQPFRKRCPVLPALSPSNTRAHASLKKCQGVADNKLAPRSLGQALIGCETLRTWSGALKHSSSRRGWRDALSGWTDPS